MVEFLVLQLLLRWADTWIKRGNAVATKKEEVHRYERHRHFHADVRTPLIVTESQARTDKLLGQGAAQGDLANGQESDALVGQLDVVRIAVEQLALES